MEESILTQHPDGKQGVRILKRRYDLISDAILANLREADTLSFKEMTSRLVEQLQESFDGKVAWYVVTVKLDLEARGLIEQIPGKSPMQLRLAPERQEPVFEGASEFERAIQKLESAGTEQNRKIYLRHGAKEPLFGVSVANLRSIAKSTGKNNECARQLWASGNFDAMALASLIDDPEAISYAELGVRVNDINYYHLADFFSSFVAKTRHVIPLMMEWTASEAEYVRRCGYTIVSALSKNAALLDDSGLEPFLDIIEREIHSSPNRAREAMNLALISIGKRNTTLCSKALDAAERIGIVYIDQGETQCNTPDAVAELSRD
jgi:3-methyladenine DNA glycosylase AlkD